MIRTKTERVTFNQRYNGFTLAEILITLGIIGIVAAMTIPVLINNYQEYQFKVAYKKAYSDISQAFAQAIQEQTLTPRTSSNDPTATEAEWEVLKTSLKTTKDCDIDQLNNCWIAGDTIWGGPYTYGCKSFIDIAGRSWAQYNDKENGFYVDVNGSTLPNKFGKDRWVFILQDTKNNRYTSGIPAKIGILLNDKTTADNWCHYPPCYYKTWLFN